ncbi:MAG TPA: hypothetical protein VF458_15510, partial [Ktedonobacteraceae bacterium]
GLQNARSTYPHECRRYEFTAHSRAFETFQQQKHLRDLSIRAMITIISLIVIFLFRQRSTERTTNHKNEKG